MSYEDIKNKFNLEGNSHFCKYLQIRNCLKGGVKITHESNPIENFMLLPPLLCKAAKWYKICPWIKNNINKSLKTCGTGIQGV